MAIIQCPFCGTQNTTLSKSCVSCGKPLPQQEGSPAAEEKPKFPPLPETPAESGPEGSLLKRVGTSPEWYAANPRYKTAQDAAGAYAEAFLQSRTNGKAMMLRESAPKKILLAVVLAVVFFLALALRMLYHRNKFLYFLIGAACVVLAWLFVFRKSSAKALGKKLASMPDTDMESILMSEFDQMVSVNKIRCLCAGLFAAAIAAVLILFWSPHMIFEKENGIVSLRFYTQSIVKETDVVIPDTWNGEPVTQIRGNVFENVSWIRSVKLPSQLQVIRAHAFQGCGSLSSVDFPSTLREIGSSAFRNCASLKEVTLPAGCSVNQKAFKGSPTKIRKSGGE